MKKIFSILAACALTLGFTACEDVPAPFGIGEDVPGTDGGMSSDSILLDETFSSSLGEFENFTTDGEGAWVIDFKTAKASGYDPKNKVNTAGTYYLVSPEVSLEGKTEAYLTYEYIYAYPNNGANSDKVLISENFDKANPTEGWEEMPVKFQEMGRTPEGKPDWKTFSTMNIQLPEKYMGKKIRVAFYHTCGERSTTVEMKNLKIILGKVQGGEEVTPTPQPGDVQGLPYGEAFSESLGAFTNYTTDGEGTWKIDFHTAKATGYDNASKTNTAGTYYLVSPEISLEGQNEVHFSYEYILAYANNFPNGDKVMISDKFNAEKASEGWEEIPVKFQEMGKTPEGKPDWKTFYTMDIQVPAKYMGKKIRVAFYHTCGEKSTTMELKNFNIAAGKAAEGGETVDPTPNPDPTPDPEPQPQPGDGTLVNWESNTVWAKDATTGTLSFEQAPYSIIVAKGESSKTPPMVHEKYFEVRAYAYNTVTVSTSGNNMKQVVFNIAKYGDEKLAGFTVSTGTITVDKANMQVIWTGDAKEFTITVSERAENGKPEFVGGYGQFRFRSLVIK